MTTVESNADIVFARTGAAGLITLNRPRALNAVTFDMVRALSAQLAQWEDDPAITRVIVTAAPGRAFCAGGDIRELYELGRAGRAAEALGYWRSEYALDAAIKRYRKPYVAVIDGVVMGGGAGISINGSHRVAGDGFEFAMPEVGLGFIPDVGATWFLSRMPGELGLYCALTGARLSPADAVASGIATHRVGSSRLPDLIEGLCGNVSVDALLGAFAEPPGEGPLTSLAPAIDRLFAGASVEAILAALDAEARGNAAAADFARATALTIRAKSPLSLKVALAQLRRGKSLDFAQCLRTEFRIVSRLVHGHDLYEGIRSVIIDKDQAPRWRPAALDAIGSAEVEAHFAPLPDELVLP
jgi:enoyl-CoA hydratase/carnithine racemase